VANGVAWRRAATAPGGDLLSLLVHARYDDGSGMSDEQISDEVRTLSLAGYETVAEALSWSWYLLAGAEDSESAVWAEVDGVATVEGGIGIPELARLPWCRMVLAESMRLYPPTWLFVRVAQTDDVLPSGVFIAAGSKIYLSQWVMHRNPRHFPDPNRFDPRRFAPEAIASRPRFTYLPFGAGRRLCIGEEFAWMQGVSIMASIARHFRLLLPSGQQVVPEPNVTLRPRGGLCMRLAAR
jgi:cytochrome P450